LVEKVRPGSPAAALGIRPGDRLIAINGQAVQDIFDYYLSLPEPRVDLEIDGPRGRRTVSIRKEPGEDVGLVFGPESFDGLRRCCNRCLFCFIDQLPSGLRPSLYVKDDDYRQSVLTGTYITLTNLTKEDWERILGLHLSPLYVSVHTVDPRRRAYLLGSRKAGEIREQLARLAAAGIEMHCQVVLCRQLNDGAYLEETLEYLSSLWPSVASIAVVPVGLTKYRQYLFPLHPFDRESSRRVLNQVARWQEQLRRRLGTRLVFAADEFYLLAGRPFPPAEEYEGFPQLENGVGVARLFMEEWQREVRRLPGKSESSRLALIVTGKAGYRVLSPLLAQLRARWRNARIELLGLDSRFFGPYITISGLLTGSDICWGLKPRLARLRREQAAVLLPNVALRENREFLDGYTLESVRRELSLPVFAVRPTAKALLRKLEVVLWGSR
jgi:putative radical SAM enzyme (TIGR03279 family)